MKESAAVTECYSPVYSLFVLRDRRDRHRSKSRDSSSRGDKSVTIQTPGEPLLDAESTRGDERVRYSVSALICS